MSENEDIVYSVSNSTIWALSFFLIALLLLLFVFYKYLNKEANGKYTVQRIVYREGGLRDRARGATVALGNRLGVQLWPQSDTDQDEEDEEMGQVNSDGGNSSDEDDPMKDNTEKSDSAAEVNSVSGDSEHNSADTSDEEEEALVKPEPEAKAVAEKTDEPAADEAEEDKGETSGPIVINHNQFSGSVLWSDEDGDIAVKLDDVTAL